MSTDLISKTRTGKIARLPRAIREQLNRRLEDGESAVTLLPWLNGQPSVQEILAAQFGARPVNAQNLSDWRTGGFQDWLHQEEDLTLVQSILEDADGLTASHLDSSASSCSSSSPPPTPDDREASPLGLSLADRLAAMAALAIAKLIRRLTRTDLECPKAQRALLQAVRTLNWLRNSDHKALRLKMDLLRWEEEKAAIQRQAHDRARAAAQSRLPAPVESRIAHPPGAPPFDTTLRSDDDDSFAAFIRRLTGIDPPLPGESSPGKANPPTSTRSCCARAL